LSYVPAVDIREYINLRVPPGLAAANFITSFKLNECLQAIIDSFLHLSNDGGFEQVSDSGDQVTPVILTPTPQKLVWDGLGIAPLATKRLAPDGQDLYDYTLQKLTLGNDVAYEPFINVELDPQNSNTEIVFELRDAAGVTPITTRVVEAISADNFRYTVEFLFIAGVIGGTNEFTVWAYTNGGNCDFFRSALRIKPQSDPSVLIP
jgi:hypothetical protein